ERHCDAGPHTVFAPPAIASVVIGFVRGEGSPEVPAHEERVCNANSTAITVAVFCWSWTKPSDVHVATGDPEPADGKSNGAVDSKLLLVVAVGKRTRHIREFIKSACRNRVKQVARSNRQKLCHANRHVNLCGRYVQLADVKAVEFEIDPLLHRNDHVDPG